MDGIGCVTIPPDEPLKLGVLQTLSGGSAPAGIEQARVVELAIAQRGGQFLGHPVDLLLQDERCSAEGGANGALRLIADPQVVAILGTNCSGAAVAAAEIMSEAGLVMISSSNTAPSLTAIGGTPGENWYPGYFRTVWNDTVMGRGAAVFAFQELGLTKAAVVHAGDTYTRGLVDVFQKEYIELGGEIVLEITVNEQDTDHRPMLTAVALAGPELMYFPLSHPETSAQIVQQATEIDGLDQLVMIGAEGMLSDVFIEAVDGAGVGVYLSGPAAPQSEANDELRAEYEETYGESPPSFYYSFTYDAVNLLFEALESVARRSEDDSLHLGRQALREALYQTRNFAGLTGVLHCDRFGDCGAIKLNIMRLDDPAAGLEGLQSNVIYTYAPAR